MVGKTCVPSSSLDGPSEGDWKNGLVCLGDRFENLHFSLWRAKLEVTQDCLPESPCFTYDSKDRLPSPVVLGGPFTSTDLYMCDGSVSSVTLMSAGCLCSSVVACTEQRDFISQGHRG